MISLRGLRLDLEAVPVATPAGVDVDQGLILLLSLCRQPTEQVTQSLTCVAAPDPVWTLLTPIASKILVLRNFQIGLDGPYLGRWTSVRQSVTLFDRAFLAVC